MFSNSIFNLYYKLRRLEHLSYISLSDIARFTYKNPNMPLPCFIQIEPTTRCNFNCETCTRKTYSTSRLNRDMTLKEFQKIIDQIPNIRKIKLQGMGEPFLNPHLRDILEYGKEKGIIFSTISNGSMLNKENIDIILNYIGEIEFSVDSIDKEKFASLRKGGNLKKIKEGIRRLVLEKEKRWAKTNIGLNFVAHHLNFTEIPELYAVGKRLGVDNVSVIEVENWKIPTEKEYESNYSFVKDARDNIENIKDIIGKIRFCKKPSFVFTNSAKRKERCRWVFNFCFITVDGYVTPCCIRMDPLVFNFGNIYKEDFKDIWNSEKYKIFRKTLIKNQPNIVCDNCPD